MFSNFMSELLHFECNIENIDAFFFYNSFRLQFHFNYNIFSFDDFETFESQSCFAFFAFFECFFIECDNSSLFLKVFVLIFKNHIILFFSNVHFVIFFIQHRHHVVFLFSLCDVH